VTSSNPAASFGSVTGLTAIRCSFLQYPIQKLEKHIRRLLFDKLPSNVAAQSD
jgi:hypothetical protein